MNVAIIGAGSIGQLIFHDIRLSDDINPVFIDTRLPADTLGTSYVFEYCKEADPSESSSETSCEIHNEKTTFKEAYQGMVFSRKATVSLCKAAPCSFDLYSNHTQLSSIYCLGMIAL